MSQASISPQLQKEAFGFCKVAKNDKKPFEQGWSKKPYQWNNPSLVSWLDSGGNYGVMGGHGDLVIFDADELDRLHELGVIALLPETFTVRTPGRGGWHLYYICKGAGKKMALYDPEKTSQDAKGREQLIHVADLVSAGMQAVGPNSVRYFPEDEEKFRSYQIINDVPITEITMEQLQEAIKILKTSPKVGKEKKIQDKREAPAGQDKRWFDELHVEDVLMPDNVVVDNSDTTGELQGAHPIHGSDNGKNFAINIKKNNWVCFRCKNEEGDYCGGGPWELLGIREGIITCDDCYKGWRRDQPKKWAAILKRAGELGIEAPRPAEGDNTSERRRDLIRYATEVIMGSEHIKTLKNGEMLIYEDGAYRFDGESKIRGIIENLGENLGGVNDATISVKREVIQHIRDQTPCEWPDFDKDPYRIGVRNGILNLMTGQLEPHSPDFLSVIQIPWDYIPGADCPEIKKFISEIVDRRDLLLMEEIAGSCLIKSYFMKRSPIFIGDTNSGKTVWINLLVSLVGSDQVAVVDLQQLSRRFQVASLMGKLLCVGDDLDNAPYKSAMFKKLNGMSPIQAEKKGKDPIWFVNYAKMTFSSNTIPYVDGLTDADVERIMLIRMPQRFGTQEELDDGIATRLKNPHKLIMMSTPAEMVGFLALAVRGAQRLLEYWEFSYSISKQDIAQMLSSAYFPKAMVKEFGSEMCLMVERVKTPAINFWNAFRTWCRMKNYAQPIGRNTFYALLAQVYNLKITDQPERPSSGANPARCFLDFVVQDSPEPLQEVGGMVGLYGPESVAIAQD